jgi:hypothetical protein
MSRNGTTFQTSVSEPVTVSAYVIRRPCHRRLPGLRITCKSAYSIETILKKIVGEQDLLHRGIVSIGDEDVTIVIDSNAMG